MLVTLGTALSSTLLLRMARTIFGNLRHDGGVIKSFRFFPHDAATNEAFERAQFALILVRHKTDGVAYGVCASGAADAMDIIFRVHWKIVIYDVRDAVHVNAARRDVRRHQYTYDAVLEIFQRAQSLALRTVGMQRRGADARRFEIARDAVGGVFHAREDEHHVHRRVFEQMQQQRGLQTFGNFVDELRHGLGWICAAANLHQLGRVLKFMRERFYLPGERRGKEQRLPFLRQRADNLANGWQETHVEHPVGLVEHEILQLREIGVAALHQIHQATGTGDDEMRAGAKGVDLWMFADAAENGGDAHRQVFAVSPDVLINLQDEFARGREDERARAALPPITDDGGKPGQHRQSERGGFARAGLRDADEVVAREDRRNGRELNGRGFRLTGFLYRLQNFWVQTERTK